MEATIVNYRRGRHTQTTNQLILMVPKVENKESAVKMVGKKVSWKTTSGKELEGEIVSAHGAKGAVRALMKTAVPGQAIGTKISILK
jgi:large subunit ribosomal protein L35Ae